MKVNTGTESSGMTMTLIRSGEKRNEKELRWEASGMKDWAVPRREVLLGSLLQRRGDSQLLPLMLRTVLPARNSLSCSIRVPNLRCIYEIGKETFLLPTTVAEMNSMQFVTWSVFPQQALDPHDTPNPFHPLGKHTALPSLLSNVFGSGSQNHQGILMFTSEILILLVCSMAETSALKKKKNTDDSSVHQQ